MTGGEIRPAGVADHKILENLAAEADPSHPVAGAHAAPRQLGVDIAAGQLDPHRPQDREGDGQRQHQRQRGDAEPPRPAPPPHPFDRRFVHAVTRPSKLPSFA